MCSVSCYNSLSPSTTTVYCIVFKQRTNSNHTTTLDRAVTIANWQSKYSAFSPRSLLTNLTKLPLIYSLRNARTDVSKNRAIYLSPGPANFIFTPVLRIDLTLFACACEELADAL